MTTTNNDSQGGVNARTKKAQWVSIQKSSSSSQAFTTAKVI